VSFSPFHVNHFLLNDFIISSSLLSADLKQTIGLMLFALVKTLRFFVGDAYKWSVFILLPE
jgi:hypothetical protein